METLFLSVGITIGCLACVALLYWFARNDVLFTFVEEGTGRAVMWFDSFHRLLISYRGYFLDTEWNLRKEGEEGSFGNDEGLEMSALVTKNGDTWKTWSELVGEEEEAELLARAWYAGVVDNQPIGQRVFVYRIRRQSPPIRFGGLYLVGIPFVHNIYEYRFRWLSFEQAQEEGRYVKKAVAHDGWLNYILLKDDVYYVSLEKAETRDLIQADIKLLLGIRIVNPYKALFRVQNWLEATLNLTLPAFRKFVARYDFEKIVLSGDVNETSPGERTRRRESLEREADAFLKESGLGRYLERNYGVRLKKVSIEDIAAAGDDGKKFMEAAVKIRMAEKEREAILVHADAEKRRMKAVYTTVQEFGEVGTFLKGTEALQEIGKGPSNLVIFPIGSAQDLVTAVTGKKKEPLIVPPTKGGTP